MGDTGIEASDRSQLAESVARALGERMRALGYTAPATFRELIALNGSETIMPNHTTPDDIATADLLTRHTSARETAAWMPRFSIAQ